MKKSLVCLALAVFMAVSLTACSGKTQYIIETDGTGVTSGVYAYFLDRIMASPEKYGIKEASKEAVSEKALSLCVDMTATEKLMKENSTGLALPYKSEVAEKTESMWSMFGEYYTSIGVSKPDITSINTFEAQKKQLVEYYFGQDGKKAVSDDDLKQKFVQMYIGFKGFEGTFTKLNAKGETTEMTEKEKEKLIEDFRKMANKINDGASIDEVYEEYCTKQGLVVTSELQVSLFKDKDPMYADDFFKKVSTISHGKAAPVTSGSSIYVVQRMTIASSDDDAFEAYREEVLSEMKMPEIEKMISKEAKKLEVVKAEKKMEKIYKALGNRH